MTTPLTDAAIVARRWVTEVMSLGNVDHDLAANGKIYVDGATLGAEALRSLVEAYQTVFPVRDVEVNRVVTWQDKAMVAYTIERATAAGYPSSTRATAFLTMAGGRIVEVWLVDDWPDWLDGHLRTG